MTRDAIIARIDALGRPGIVLNRGLAGVQASRAAALAWDATYPEAAFEYRQLCAELEAVDQAIKQRAEAERQVRAVEVQLERAFGDTASGERPVAVLDRLTDTPALGFARAWMESKACWLLLCGATSQGKTVAAVWAMRVVLLGGGSAAYRPAARIARMSGFDEGAVELARLARVDLLVVDDVGAESNTAWGSGLLGELLDARHLNKKRTVLVSNLKFDAFKARVGERVVERIAEDGSTHQLAAGPSLRRKGKAA